MKIFHIQAVKITIPIRMDRKELKTGISTTLNNMEQDKWIVRSYLLSGKNANIPLKEISVPLATLLLASTDPIDYVTKSWWWTKVSSSTSSDGGGPGAD